MQNNIEHPDKSEGFIKKFIKPNLYYIIFFLFVVLMLVPYIIKFHGGLSSDSEKWDHFGSYIGGIFSAITLLIILHGMKLERKRFDEQKAEYEKDKREQECNKRKENFEKTFFMMLEQHNINLRELDTGKNIINKVYEKILSDNTFHNIRFNLSTNYDLYSRLDTYFLNLYRILKFIYKNKELNIDNEYSSLLRSFLSKELLTILAYHLCNREKQYKNYIDYINEFSLLEHLDLNELEFSFLSHLTSIDKVELRKHFASYTHDKEEFYGYRLYNDENSENGLQALYEKLREKQGELKEIEIIINKIVNIFRKKEVIEEILKEDYLPDEKDKPYTEYIDCFLETKKLYKKILPLEDEKKIKNVFFYILDTFSEQAFAKEQEKKFKDLKVIYKNFIKELK